MAVNAKGPFLLCRAAEAREVVRAFLYLASDASAYVTGTWLDINGGLLVR